MNIKDFKGCEQSKHDRTVCQSSTIVGQKLHRTAMGWPETQQRILSQHQKEENTRKVYYLSLWKGRVTKIGLYSSKI